MQYTIKDFRVNSLPSIGQPNSRYYVLNGQGTDIDEYVTDLNGDYHKVNPIVSGSGGTTVKVSSNDTTSGFLNGKLVVGSGISFTENNDGGNETLSISLDSSYTNGLYWNKLGDAGTTIFTNFIGTTDAAGLRFKTNNLNSGLIDITSTAHTSFGHRAGENWTSGVWSTLIGYWAGRSMVVSSENTAIGAYSMWNAASSSNVAVGSNTLTHATTPGIRNAVVGTSGLVWTTSGRENSVLGNFGMLANRQGSYNVAVGSSSMRGNVKGQMNTAVGHITLTQNTTNIASINVVSGGSGYTTATVVISAPTVLADPNNNSLQATATAQISGGAIVGVTITQAGKGYTDITDGTGTAVTATIVGDGTGAVLSVTLQSGDGNIAVGIGAMAFNLAGSFNVAVGGLVNNNYGNYNTAIGYTALATNVNGSYNTTLGYLADISSSTGTNRNAIGTRAYCAQDNSMVLGSVNGVNGATVSTSVGIGVTAPTQALDVAGNIYISGALMQTESGYTNIIDLNQSYKGFPNITFTTGTGSANTGAFYMASLGTAVYFGTTNNVGDRDLVIQNYGGSRSIVFAQQVEVGRFATTTGNFLIATPTDVNSAYKLQVTGESYFKSKINIAGSTSGLITVQPAAAAGTWTWTLPTNDGNANDVLITDGSGISSWVAPSSIITSYTDENAQDAVGGILTDTNTIDFTYNDAGNQITADIKVNGIDNAQFELLAWDGVDIYRKEVSSMLAISGKVIYVDNASPNATDSRGSFDRHDFVHPYATIAAALVDYQDGDTLLIMPGTYNENLTYSPSFDLKIVLFNVIWNTSEIDIIGPDANNFTMNLINSSINCDNSYVKISNFDTINIYGDNKPDKDGNGSSAIIATGSSEGLYLNSTSRNNISKLKLRSADGYALHLLGGITHVFDCNISSNGNNAIYSESENEININNSVVSSRNDTPWYLNTNHFKISWIKITNSYFETSADSCIYVSNGDWDSDTGGYSYITGSRFISARHALEIIATGNQPYSFYLYDNIIETDDSPIEGLPTFDASTIVDVYRNRFKNSFVSLGGIIFNYYTNIVDSNTKAFQF